MRDRKGVGSKAGVEEEKLRSCLELNGKEFNFRSIMKDVELLGSSDMTWKERKDLQNRKIVSLGGKAPTKQRLPLSVARLMMKNQKIREQKKLQEELLCGHYGNMPVKSTKQQQKEKRRPEDTVLKSSVGRFRNGVLDVKHLLRPARPATDDDRTPPMANKRKKGKKGGKKNGKRKGGGRKRH